MATIYSVGTASRNYSTISAALTAVCSPMTGDITLELYNDSQFTDNIVITASMCVSPYTLTIKAATGQSFYDNGGRLSNALRYNQANGVGISASKSDQTSIHSLRPATGSTLIFDGIQFEGTGTTQTGLITNGGAGSKTSIFRNCIIQMTGNVTGGSNNPVVLDQTGFEFDNCLIIACGACHTAVQADGYFNNVQSTQLNNCTIMKLTSTASSIGIIYSTTGANAYKANNTAVFGFVSATTNTTAGTGDYNATDISSGFPSTGTHNVYSLTFASQFQNIAGTSTVDARVATGSALIGAGTRDATHTSDLDIVKSARSTTAPTIGAWEYANGRVPSMLTLGVG